MNVRTGYLLEQIKEKMKCPKFYGSVAGKTLRNEISRFARAREKKSCIHGFGRQTWRKETTWKI
jgi:hypothetical protein